MKYTTKQIEDISAKLKEMPAVEKKKQEHSKAEAVQMLSKEIFAMQKRGYSLEQIADALRDEGLVIATPTLRSYLQRAKKAGKKQIKPETGDTPRAAISRQTGKRVSAPKPDTEDI